MTYDQIQARIDKIRTFQLKHHLIVARITNALKGRPQNPAQLREELDHQNIEMERAIETRAQLDAQLRDLSLKRREEEKARDNVRQIVCALLANPELVDNEHADIVNDAAQIELLIQSLPIS